VNSHQEEDERVPANKSMSPMSQCRVGSFTTTMVSKACLLHILCAQEHRAEKERIVAVDSFGGNPINLTRLA
jgi:mannose/fructose-specific phosphotransferase system component IIA